MGFSVERQNKENSENIPNNMSASHISQSQGGQKHSNLAPNDQVKFKCFCQLKLCFQ